MMPMVLISHGLLALYLMTLLSVPKTQSALAALVCLTAIVGSQWRRPPAIGQRVAESRWLLWPLLAYMALIVLQMLNGHLQARDADQLLMCLLAVGVLLSAVPAEAPPPRRWLFPAAALGAMGAFAVAAWQSWVLDIFRPYGHLGVGRLGSGAIKFGDLAGLLGLFSLLMLLDASRQPRWYRVLGVLGALAGGGALGLAQARGGVVGVAVALAVLFLLLLRRRQRTRQAAWPGRPAAGSGQKSLRLRGMMAALLGVVVLLGTAQVMSPRFADIGPQYERFLAGDQDSEIGQRLAIWGVAWRAGLREPLTGVGLNGLGAEIRRQRASGELPADTLVLYEGAHNEYLSAFAGAGIPGLLVIVGLFGGPLLVGARRFLAGQHRDAALALVVLATAFGAFSLTDSMFDRQISMLAYLLLSSWLMAASRPSSPAHRHSPLPGPGGAGDQPAFGVDDAGSAGRGLASAAGEGGAQAAAGAADVGAAEGARAIPGGLSVAIITLNEAHRIEACLRSVAFADQVVVLDSGSRDETVAIARRLGAEVEVTADWPGFGVQKNRALARCSRRWVLSLDADERLSPGLAAEIRQVLAATPPGQPVAGYWLRRSSTFCGQVIRHGLWGNDRVLRLFERQQGHFSEDQVHERLICDGQTRVLDGVLLHDSVDSLEDARNKTRQYALLGAAQMRARQRGGRLRAWLHGGWSFVRGYLLRGGFLDGRAGWILAGLHARGTFWKYRWAALPAAEWQALQAGQSAPEPADGQGTGSG